MSASASGALRALKPLTDHEFRRRRLSRQREALGHRLEEFLCELPESISFDFSDLRHLAGYRLLEPEGLVHARLVRPGSNLVVLAATARVLKKDDLRFRLFALRKLAEREFKRVVIATPAGLLNEARRMRLRRAAGLVLAPNRLHPLDGTERQS